jgi:Rps23 Pro-64 3,4-dihydroxylase Tpa1-like proline 4-hydroxylase
LEITRTPNYILIDDWLPQGVIDDILKELEYLEPLTEPNVMDRYRVVGHKQSHITLVDNHFEDRSKSAILSAFDQYLWSKEFEDEVLNHPDTAQIFKILPHTEFDSTELQIYGDGGWYTDHKDDATFGELVVCNLLMCRNPKKFTGGELVVEGEKIEHKQNRLLIFPSLALHSVEEVHMESNDPLDGRISLQHRSWFKQISPIGGAATITPFSQDPEI